MLRLEKIGITTRDNNVLQGWCFLNVLKSWLPLLDDRQDALFLDRLSLCTNCVRSEAKTTVDWANRGSCVAWLVYAVFEGNVGLATDKRTKLGQDICGSIPVQESKLPPSLDPVLLWGGQH